MIVWLIFKQTGECHRAADGLPYYFGSKREAKAFAQAKNWLHYSLMPVRG